jgi:phage tail sheath protein FI
MSFSISPGITVSEIDLTTIIPAVGTTVGALAGPFRWGPANKPMLVDSELTLLSTFGKPDNDTANCWFTAANFLAYANALQTVRVVKAGSTGHKNSTTATAEGLNGSGNGLLIMNEDAYLNNFANGQANSELPQAYGMFAAKYPGDLGNSLAVSIADADSFGSWTYKTSFPSAPNSSAIVAQGGGTNDEMHIVVVDSLGLWSGTAGTVLETYAFVSKCAASKYEDGSTMYYPEVINRTSKYIWWLGHPTEADLGISSPVNWGSSSTTENYQTTSEKVTLGTINGTFLVDEVIGDSTGAIVSSGSNAVLGTPVVGAGGIAAVALGTAGSNYVVPPTVSLSGDGASAVVTANISGGHITSYTVTVPGTGYTTATPSLDLGSGASASVVIAGSTVTGFTSVVGGSNYAVPPTVTVTLDGSATGSVTAHAVIGTVAPNIGKVTSVVIGTNTSATVTSATVGFTPVDGGGAPGSATFNTGKVLSVPITSGGSGYVAVPTVHFTGGAGINAAATVVLVNQVVDHIVVTNGGSGYNNTLTQAGAAPSATVVPTGSGATAVVTVDGTGRVTALTPTAIGSGYTAATVEILGPGVGASITPNIVGGQVTSYTVNPGGGGSGYQTISARVLSIGGPVLSVSPISGQFTDGLVLTGVTSGASGTVTALGGGEIYLQLADGVDSNHLLEAGDYQADVTGAPAGYALFRSGEDIDVSLILGADLAGDGNWEETALFIINDVAEYRKDCVAFLSPQQSDVVDNSGNEAADIIAHRNLLPSTSYAVMDSGWKYQYDKYNDLYRWVPLNGDVAGLCVRTDNLRDPWWSPAGYNRGFIQNVVRLAWNPRKAYRDLMYQSGVNPVMSEPGQGTLLFGDKTMLTKPSAFDRINVRRLFIVLEKAISTAAKYTLFEFNDQFTQAQFVNMVDPYLRDVMGRRGIYDYRVVCDATNNTPTVVDANQFVGDIYIKPARSINFIQLNFIAVRTGVDFSEIVGKF